MNLLNMRISKLVFFLTISLATAVPDSHDSSEIAVPEATGSIAALSFMTQISSSAEFGGTCELEAPGATLLLLITVSTVTTIQPAVTSYPTTILQTVITEWTVRFDFYYTEAPYTSFRSGIESQPPTTTVLLGPPSITAPFNAPVTGTLCWCSLQPAHNITPCGAMCCIHTLYPTDLF
jgi:hypothetical protein